jgi:formamidopyrimidine-DNA glycosylase
MNGAAANAPVKVRREIFMGLLSKALTVYHGDLPELPEVETVARSIAPLVGRRIVSAEFTCLRILRGGDPDVMAEQISGRKIKSIQRYGKFIVVSLQGGGFLTIHLGMTGRLLLGGDRGKHTHAVFTLSRGVLLYDDSRQFGALEYSDEFPARVARLGPEPLEIKFEDFAAALKKRNTRMKALLLNQTFIRGVGNIYADEALFRAGVHPLAIASRLRGDRVRRLYDAIIAVLTEAIEAGGSSISDYVDAEGRSGFFQFHHRVYQRTGEPCITCGTPIKRILVAQRSSHFCPKCQRR